MSNIPQSPQPALFPSPHLLLRRTIECEIVQKMMLEGYFEVDLIDAKSGVIKQHLEFRNLITDVGLNALGSNTASLNSSLTYLAVGTGNSTPDVTQTALDSEVGRTNNAGSFSDTFTSGPSFEYWEGARVRLFTEAQANGVLAELGFFNLAAAGIMFNRQLFRDGSGVPITIPKTSSDQLRVTYKWRIYSNQIPVVQSINISGVTTDVTNRAYRVDVNSGWGGALTPGASGLVLQLGLWNTNALAGDSNVMPTVTNNIANTTSANRSSGTLQSYVNDTFYKDIEYVWEPGVGNFTGGIGNIAVSLTSSPTALTTFSPKVNKDNTKRFVIMNRYSWARRP